jgi:hypothetical protein
VPDQDADRGPAHLVAVPFPSLIFFCFPRSELLIDAWCSQSFIDIVEN